MGSLGIASATGGQKTTALVESVDSEAACALLASGQYGYVDVRMWEDFDVGHVAGARNVPYYLSVTPRGRPERNPHFVEQVAALHAKKDRLLLGCRQGVRSRLAAADLLDAGFKNVKNLQGGYLSLLKCVNPQPLAYHQ
uniref:Uncharacterized protein n=1 Tax=Avena sativa TaxID=4498 RepID=A0ACD5WWI9_AVESA